jgi:hypothetical protein
MSKRCASRAPEVDSPLIGFLAAFAEFLLAAGIKSPRFAAMMRLAFFRAASDSAKLGNYRINQSSVAAMTGLTRVQVRKFARQNQPVVPAKPDRIEKVVDGWTTDPWFATRTGGPRRIPISGRGATFRSLVRKYGGDLPHRAVLREMLRRNLVSSREGLVSLRPAVRRTREEAQLAILARSLTDLLKGPRVIAPAALRTFNLEVSYPSASEKGRLLLHKRTSERLSAFLASIEASGVAASVDSPARNRQSVKLCRTRVMLVTEDLEQ